MLSIRLHINKAPEKQRPDGAAGAFGTGDTGGRYSTGTYGGKASACSRTQFTSSIFRQVAVTVELNLHVRLCTDALNLD